MEKYFEKIIKDYEKVLSEELGEGNLKKRLLSGLEKIFSEKTSQNNFLDKPFDYRALFDENPKTLAVRISNCLKSQEIETYNDLAGYCYGYFRSNWKRWKSDEQAYFKYLRHVRNLGDKSADAVLSHLKSIDFNFSEEYAREVFEKD